MKRFITVLCFFLIVDVVCGQSYHFSQFFSTPLLTNPAQTGFIDGPVRVSSNIRSQGNPAFFTGYLSMDLGAFRNQLAMGNKAGIGVYVMNDQSMSSAIQTNSVGLSAAYHVGLDTYGEHSFGVGIQGTYNQRRIDYSKLSFENQYGPAGYDASLPVGEPLDLNSKHFFDVNAGVLYNAVSAGKAFFAGASAYNILQHHEEMIGDEFKIPMRLALQGGAQFSLGKLNKLYTSFTTMYQGKANETTVGAAYGVQFTEGERNELMGGIWYRYKDAVIPFLGFQYNSLQVGLSYDYTVSSAKTGAEIRNGYELTLSYRAADKRELQTHIPWF